MCIKLVKYLDKYTEKHSQQNVKKLNFRFYNQVRECLLRSTNWVFKSDIYIFVLKELTRNNSLQLCRDIVVFDSENYSKHI